MNPIYKLFRLSGKLDRLKNHILPSMGMFFPKKEYDQYKKGGRWMDLIKIGKYIAGKRKSLGMTQKQLAEKIGMSDKFVSKWERGVSQTKGY